MKVCLVTTEVSNQVSNTSGKLQCKVGRAREEPCWLEYRFSCALSPICGAPGFFQLESVPLPKFSPTPPNVFVMNRTVEAERPGVRQPKGIWVEEFTMVLVG